ncbi:hypothetical protein [Lapidilactobacillus wuchangensis]|uniref:hypothetical protein n=1 Tax=Lapidilactobacillus wuchangensis TaxID=2486001 RepID=UPI000F78CA50|nr:hypothetical protein [Lapidilactobacillus wuchangensis]
MSSKKRQILGVSLFIFFSILVLAQLIAAIRQTSSLEQVNWSLVGPFIGMALVMRLFSWKHPWQQHQLLQRRIRSIGIVLTEIIFVSIAITAVLMFLQSWLTPTLTDANFYEPLMYHLLGAFIVLEVLFDPRLKFGHRWLK